MKEQTQPVKKEIVQNGDDEARDAPETLLELKQTESDKFPIEERENLHHDYNHFLLEEEHGDKRAKAMSDSNPPDLRPKISNETFDGLLSIIDGLCPAWIEMWASQGKYTRAYAFNVDERTVFRTPQSFKDLIGVGNYIKGNISEAAIEKMCSPRISKAEKTRRLFGTMLDSAFSGKNGGSLKRLMELYSTQFLRRRDKEKNALPSETGRMAARALSDRHWVEEWAEVTERAISFAHPENRKVHFSINMECVLDVRVLEEDEVPLFHNYHFLAIETLGRTTYAMFATENDRNKILSRVSSFIKKIASKRTKSEEPSLCLNYPREEFLRKSTMWTCNQRLIMNARAMSFRAPPPTGQVNALRVVEQALRRALDPDIEEDDDKLKEFLDYASTLKDVSASALRDDRRLAFFLNLYHLMVAHANLILGETDSQTTLKKNFSCLSYQCSDDIFSISELEHCIIRAQMTPLAPSVPSTNAMEPPAINSRLLKKTSPFRTIPPVSFNFTTPTSNFCFAVQRADFRINFALNCGSISNPKEIAIYMPETLDEQLDGACHQYLHSNVTIKKRNNQHVCMLPRVCQWYASDFGESNYSILKTLERYLGHHERKFLDSIEFANFPVTLKYLPFDFECHTLVLKDEPFLQTGSFDTEASSDSSSFLPSSVSEVHTVNTMTEADADSLLDHLMDDALAL